MALHVGCHRRGGLRLDDATSRGHKLQSRTQSARALDAWYEEAVPKILVGSTETVQIGNHIDCDGRYRGGEHTWENVVSACADCNRKKAGKTPREANMKLIRTPLPPTGNPLFVIPYHYLSKRDEWQKYLYQ